MNGKEIEKSFPNLYTPADVKRIEEEIDEIERQLKPPDDSVDVGFMSHAASKIQDKNELRKELAKRKIKKDRFTPKPFASGQEANKALAWAKSFESWYKENGPTVREDDMMATHPDFQKAVKHSLFLARPEVQQRIQVYRHLLQRLDPHNPNAGDLSRLRRRG
ncbi:MAG: hypothetical protein V2B18_05915 [Pseudomonadota bacterium]